MYSNFSLWWREDMDDEEKEDIDADDNEMPMT